MENVAVKERTPLITKFVAVELMLTAVLYLVFAMFASSIGISSVSAIAASVSVISGVAFTLMIFNARKNK